MASPLLLLGGIAMAIEFFSGEKGQGARFVTGSLMVCGLVFGGLMGIFILAGGGLLLPGSRWRGLCFFSS